MADHLAENLRRIAAEGLAADSHAYDVERYQEVEALVDRLGYADANEVTTVQASLEALAKTGWSLSRDEGHRERFAKLIKLARELGGGSEFFGPAAPPRTELDNRLVSVSSRYVTPKVGVNAVVDDGTGRILMIQRADRGEWCIPGGYADVGLSGAEVAAKEAFEETGYEVEVVALLGEWSNLQHEGQRIPQYSLMYHCWVIGGSEKRHEEETLDLRWFKRNEVPSRIWQNGDPWMEIALRAVEGVKQAAYFDKPRHKVNS